MSGLNVAALFLTVFWQTADCATAGLISAAQKGENLQENQVVLVTEQKQVWINCRAAEPNQSLPEGFCDRLLSDFTKITGQEISADATLPEGMAGLMVVVDQVSGHRAAITLIAGRGQDGAFVESARQEMRLGGADAALTAGSAQALIYPMVRLLPKLP